MKILYLNTCEGARDKKRYDKIKNFLHKQKAEVVLLLELDNWNTNNRMKDISSFINLPYHLFSLGNIGIFSKYPIINIKSIDRGILKIHIKKGSQVITIISVHLSHLNENKRVQQINEIIKQSKNDKNIIIMGDFNSLSPIDKYNEKKLLKSLQAKNIKKFGTNRIHKDVHILLLNKKFIDALRLFSKEREYSVPTKMNTDINHIDKLRLDYVYVSESLKDNLIQTKILRNEETETLSDHYPVISTFNF